MKKHYVALLATTEWLSTWGQVVSLIESQAELGWSFLKIKHIKKYLLFGPTRYKIHFITTYESLQLRKQQLLTNERYETIGYIDALIKNITDFGPVL